MDLSNASQPIQKDLDELILIALSKIGSVTMNGSEDALDCPRVKLAMILDNETGWLLFVKQMISLVPLDDPYGPIFISEYLDQSPLLGNEPVLKLLNFLKLNREMSRSNAKPIVWHRNVCIALGCIAEKLAGWFLCFSLQKEARGNYSHLELLSVFFLVAFMTGLWPTKARSAPHETETVTQS